MVAVIGLMAVEGTILFDAIDGVLAVGGVPEYHPEVMAKDLSSLQILTPRLLLRPLRMEDFESWAAFMADPEAARYLGGVK